MHLPEPHFICWINSTVNSNRRRRRSTQKTNNIIFYRCMALDLKTKWKKKKRKNYYFHIENFKYFPCEFSSSLRIHRIDKYILFRMADYEWKKKIICQKPLAYRNSGREREPERPPLTMKWRQPLSAIRKLGGVKNKQKFSTQFMENKHK